MQAHIICEVLAPLANNPNAPGPNYKTPMKVATDKEIIKILQAYLQPPNDSPRRSKRLRSLQSLSDHAMPPSKRFRSL